MDKMPVPPTGSLSGREGTMMLRGSAGRLAADGEDTFAPTSERCNPTGLDHFTGGDSAGEDAY